MRDQGDYPERIAWQCKTCKKVWHPDHPVASFVRWFNECVSCEAEDHKNFAVDLVLNREDNQPHD